jgi:hypothetical protein
MSARSFCGYGRWRKKNACRAAGVTVGRLGLGQNSGARVIPGDARNIRTGDSDVGEFPIAQAMKLLDVGVVAAPSLEQAKKVG